MILSFQLDLVHLGAKYGPCMRWDETIDREIQNDRNKVTRNIHLELIRVSTNIENSARPSKETASSLEYF